MAQMPSRSSSNPSVGVTASNVNNIEIENHEPVSRSTHSSLHQVRISQGQPFGKSSHLTEPQAGLANVARRRLFRWWQGFSIRRKVSAIAIVIGIAPVISIGAISYYFADQSLTNQIKEAERLRATQLAHEVNLFMFERFGDIQVLSQLPIFTDAKLYEEVSKERKTSILDSYIELYGVYDSAAYFNLNGDVLVQSKGSPLANRKTEDYFQKVLKTGKATINSPLVSQTTGALNMHLVAPVKNINTNEIKGVVYFQLPVKKLDKIIQEYTNSENNHFLIDGNDKYFLIHGAQDRVGKPVAEHFAKYAKLREAQEGGSVFDIDPDDGSQKLLTYIPLNKVVGLSELNFGVLTASDVKTKFAPLQQLLTIIQIGTVGTALLIVAIATLLANRATHPILKAADAVKKIGEGKLETRLNFEGSDEIAALGSNINTMTIQLQTSLDALTFEARQEQILTDAKGSGALRSADLQEIFDEAIQATHALLKPDRLVFYRFNTDDSRGIVSESVSAGWASALKKNVDDACIPAELREAYQRGRIVVANNITQAGFHAEHLELLHSLDVKASLIVPVIASGQLFGLLIAHHCSAPYEWQNSEINFLKQLGNELALSIYRIELLEHSTKLAEEQRQLREGIQRRALELLREVEPISQGDLTTRAKVTADEIGTLADSYNSTVNNLRKIVLQVQEAANQVTTTTHASQTSVQTLSADALSQAEEIATTLEVIRTMTHTAQEVATNAEKAKVVMQQAVQTVETGDVAMNRTVDGIRAIRTTVAETAKKVKHLGESSQKISTVVELISAFAAQTNMLALNASIEASRAGEEGRGFAVVATEVRELARQSAEATEEIRKLVASIQAETNQVVVAMESGTEQVMIGTQLVDETRQNLTKISTASSQINQLVTAIAKATAVQSQASDVVSQTMKNVATMSDKTSTEVRQVSSSFEQLQKVAQALQESIDQFKVS
jgi:methyl-accepting chemotaxis protein